jgi:hypothetical protein
MRQGRFLNASCATNSADLLLQCPAASLMIAAGASVKAVQQAIGHASAAVTLDRYSHLYQDDLQLLARRLEGRYELALLDQQRRGEAQASVTGSLATSSS